MKKATRAKAQVSVKRTVKTTNSECLPESISKKRMDELIYKNEFRIHPALQGYLGYLFSKAAMASREEYQKALKEVDMEIHHMGILTVLGSGYLNQNQLGEELGVDKASMVKVLDAMEAQDLVERVPSKEDRRVKFVHVTPKGRKAFQAAIKIRQATEDRIFGFLTKEERAQFRDVVFRVLVGLGRV